ncbi:cupredoxin domain-containing protein [Paraburkholderia mimosarum]|uniref:hypothetical protein n=1 Tax=Paraburkholderia mimosarum TaxID=312026 RepID=UPI000418A36E|nr:hypothetical protein [Paraburkholderia mimosarum]
MRIRFVTAALTVSLLGALGAAPVAMAGTTSFTLVGGAENDNGQADWQPGPGNHNFLGRSGSIDGQWNPTLVVKKGDKVNITLFDNDQRGQPEFLSIPELGLQTPVLHSVGQSATLSFVAVKPGTFEYSGAVSFGRHNHQHMTGEIVVNP